MHALHIFLFILTGLSLAFAIQSLRLWRRAGQSEAGLMAAPETSRKHHRRFCYAMAVAMIILTTNSLITAVFNSSGFHLWLVSH